MRLSVGCRFVCLFEAHCWADLRSLLVLVRVFIFFYFLSKIVIFCSSDSCKTGKHTTEKPVTAKPVATPKIIPPSSASASNASAKDSCSRCRQGFFCSDHGNSRFDTLYSLISSCSFLFTGKDYISRLGSMSFFFTHPATISSISCSFSSLYAMSNWV